MLMQESKLLQRGDITMNRKLASRFVVGLLLLCAASTLGGTIAFAGIEPVPWLPSTGGFDNPVFWVLFNPQPEPPGYEMKVKYDIDGNLVFTASYGNDGLGLLFGATGPAGLFDSISYWKTPTGSGLTSVVTKGTEPPLYTADFTFASGGISFPGSSVAFNPQPEPPGAPPLNVWLKINLFLDDTGTPVPVSTDVEMTMRLTDRSGDLIHLVPVSEPATILLVGAGLASLAARRCRNRRV